MMDGIIPKGVNHIHTQSKPRGRRDIGRPRRVTMKPSETGMGVLSPNSDMGKKERGLVHFYYCIFNLIRRQLRSLTTRKFFTA